MCGWVAFQEAQPLWTSVRARDVLFVHHHRARPPPPRRGAERKRRCFGSTFFLSITIPQSTQHSSHHDPAVHPAFVPSRSRSPSSIRPITIPQSTQHSSHHDSAVHPAFVPSRSRSPPSKKMIPRSISCAIYKMIMIPLHPSPASPPRVPSPPDERCGSRSTSSA